MRDNNFETLTASAIATPFGKHHVEGRVSEGEVLGGLPAGVRDDKAMENPKKNLEQKTASDTYLA